MIAAVVLTVCLLGLPVALPTFLLVGFSLDMVFLLPLAGALVAALSAILEVAIGGTMLAWFIGLCVAANVVAVTAVVRRNQPLLDQGGPRAAFSVQSVVQFVLVAVVVAWPLQALAARDLGYDTNAVWLVRAIQVFGGHGALLTAIRAPLAITANPDYPPLVPASTAAGFVVRGHIVYDMGVAIPAVLNACAVAVLICGLIRVARQRGSVGAWPGLLIGAAVGLTAFGLAGSFAVNGYADLLWSASAVAAVVFGLVLPSTARNLAVAWLCATVAALTKNEGLAVALVILFLSAVRFVPSPGRTGILRDTAAVRAVAVVWLQRVTLALLLAIPGLSWTVLIRAYGVQDSFFVAGLGFSTRGRAGPTVSAMWAQLHLLPIVALIAAGGVLALRARRRRSGLANEAWIWACLCASLVFTASTYIFGDLDLSWWLATSVDRTTIFPALLLYTDLAIWMCVAGGELLARRTSGGRRQPLHAPSPPDPEPVPWVASPVP